MSSSSPRRIWLWFTLIRVGLFFGVLLVLLALSVTPIVAAIVAAVIALCISVIFLSGPRTELAGDLRKRVRRRRTAATTEDADAESEDAALDVHPGAESTRLLRASGAERLEREGRGEPDPIGQTQQPGQAQREN